MIGKSRALLRCATKKLLSSRTQTSFELMLMTLFPPIARERSSNGNLHAGWYVYFGTLNAMEDSLQLLRWIRCHDTPSSRTSLQLEAESTITEDLRYSIASGMANAQNTTEVQRRAEPVEKEKCIACRS